MKRNDAGESLVEVVIAVVLLGSIFAALMAGLATAARASKTHRDVASIDNVLRDYAEATKIAVRSCVTGGSYVVQPSDVPGSAGFSLSGLSPTNSCPAPTTTATMTLTVADSFRSRSLQIVVRTP
ncbi:MAG: hypothetical protein ABJD24_16760 [Acidimicrobiales bacterium]